LIHGAARRLLLLWWSGRHPHASSDIDGPYFNAVGPIRLSTLTVDGNGGGSVEGSTSSDVLITCVSLAANGADGWYLSTPGVVTLTGGFSRENGGQQSLLPSAARRGDADGLPRLLVGGRGTRPGRGLQLSIDGRTADRSPSPVWDTQTGDA
jgi:hypothetical protein